MNDTDAPLVSCGWSGCALETGVSGDLQVFESWPGGALLAVIDGLGHGSPAAEASSVASDVLIQNPRLPLDQLFERCHAALRKTRGAVMSAVQVDGRTSTLQWCGVGNVEGLLLRQGTLGGRSVDAISNRGGVVGYRLPPLRVSTVSLLPSDLLVMATDGIKSGFSEALAQGGEPQELADAVLARYAKGSDDALVLVARYWGSA